MIRDRRQERPVGRTVVVATMLMVGLVGCGRATNPEPAGDRTASSEPATTAKKRATTTTETADTERAAGKRLTRDGDVIGGIDFGAAALAPGHTYEGWSTRPDDRSVIEVDVPSAWSDVDTRVGDLGGVPTPGIFASTDLTAFAKGYETPGAKVSLYGTALTGVGHEGIVDRLAGVEKTASACNPGGAKTAYDDGLYEGTAQLWTGCGPKKGALLIVVAGDPKAEPPYYLVIDQMLVTTADIEAAARILGTFRFTGRPGDIPQETSTTTTAAGPPPSAPPSTTAPVTTAPPVDDTAAAQQAVTMVQSKLAVCGLGWDWTSTTKTAPGQWEVRIWIVPPGTPGENGDAGEGTYLVDLDRQRVVSTNGTANVLCPG